MSHLAIRGVRLVYRSATADAALVALEDFSLEVERGELVAIVGPSGCGKSSLLQVVAGLLRPARGEVLLNDRPVRAPGQDRALVFQEFALLPWRTALRNVELGPELNGMARDRRRELARDSLKMVGLEGFEHYYPHQLSGGMRQRVGLARALAVGPEVLLMDEPFGALDAQTRYIMSVELLRIWERDRKTILFVTHDIDEAVYLADRVVVMSAGPGRVIETLDVGLPRPRDLDVRNTEVFAAYRRRIWEHLENEVRATLRWTGAEAGHAGR